MVGHAEAEVDGNALFDLAEALVTQLIADHQPGPLGR
jgi:hypothetical protein